MPINHTSANGKLRPMTCMNNRGWLPRGDDIISVLLLPISGMWPSRCSCTGVLIRKWGLVYGIRLMETSVMEIVLVEGRIALVDSQLRTWLVDSHGRMGLLHSQHGRNGWITPHVRNGLIAPHVRKGLIAPHVRNGLMASHENVPLVSV